ncbi:DUF6503 family protein [Flavobacterium degerlachei]|jgi:hypothetical protein|uniref:Outer membrane lipoprotein-sorting protein n=1 Tax=Flavobacterium degerlachei TaxID=229203 RepID=A0A1H2UEI1_9FLAO|nr:DUF6503 family protein [Flavobacterium degerlachei]SDW54561.1 hypothetical protein SAMN05444338_103152 [Flavobacterium degerlachei]
MNGISKLVLILLLVIFDSNSLSAQSDAEKANAIVNEMLDAMGGIKNYNNTHFIQWEFVKRKLYWDKWTGDVRVENPEANQTILVNINTLKGKVYENGVLVVDVKKANELLIKAKNWWINDSYWLVMPWKLQDPGVNLTYVKTEKLANGKTVDILQLTFNQVGVTPDNKYWLYVDQQDHLIKQWAYYKNFDDAEPKFLKPWDNYQKAGTILLSFNRVNEDVGPKNVIVKSDFDASIFSKL